MVKSPAELPVVAEAMTFYKTLHGKEDRRKQEAGNRLALGGRSLIICSPETRISGVCQLVFPDMLLIRVTRKH